MLDVLQICSFELFEQQEKISSDLQIKNTQLMYRSRDFASHELKILHDKLLLSVFFQKMSKISEERKGL